MKKRIVCLLMIGIMVSTPVMTYASDSFKGWDDETKEDAWSVYSTTEWSKMQSSLILDRLGTSCKADVSNYIRTTYEKVIREELEAMDDGYYDVDAYVEIMLAMLSVMGGSAPPTTDPFNVKKYLNEKFESTESKSIQYVAKRLFSMESAYMGSHDDMVSPYVNNDALRITIQGIMYDTSYVKNAKKYSGDESQAYYDKQKEKYDERGLKKIIDFGDQVCNKITTMSVTTNSSGAPVVSGNGYFTHPCPGMTAQTSYFGEVRSFDSRPHKGNDYAAPAGTPTYAAADGKVIIAGWSNSAGNWVVIDHGNGLVTKYMHHSEILVSAGQTVKKGQQIGKVGSTGYSTGAHLHFQVELNGVAVNPDEYL